LRRAEAAEASALTAAHAGWRRRLLPLELYFTLTAFLMAILES